MRRGRALLVLGACAALGVAALVGALTRAGGARDSLAAVGSLPAAASLAATGPSSEVRSGGAAAGRPDPGALPPSLAGTEPDGALVVDASGAFVPTPDAIDFFDYYLSALGEQTLDEIVATLEREIRARVEPPDAALALLASYLAYRDEVRALVETRGLDGLPLDRRLQWLRETRRRVFGPELAARLFGEEEERARAAIARREAAAGPDLDPEERDRLLDSLYAELPEAERDRRARVTVAQRTLARESEMQSSGLSRAEIQAWREAEFGAEAAARLAERDRRRAEWDGRVDHYRAERARLAANGFANEVEEAAAIEALRASLFEGPELARIRALDEMAARGAQRRERAP